MNDVEAVIEIAQVLQDKGETEAALEQFSKAFDLLADNAAQHARTHFRDIDLETLRTMKVEVLAESKQFLKKDITAAYLLNAMGVLFAEMKDYGNAQQKLTEAMEYIPDGTDFSDPADNLERLATEIAAMLAEQEEQSEEL